MWDDAFWAKWSFFLKTALFVNHVSRVESSSISCETAKNNMISSLVDIKIYFVFRMLDEFCCHMVYLHKAVVMACCDFNIFLIRVRNCRLFLYIYKIKTFQPVFKPVYFSATSNWMKIYFILNYGQRYDQVTCLYYFMNTT